MPKRQSQADYAAELEKDHARWAELFSHGGSDPFWSNGMNLMLVRNHIINNRRHIEESMAPEDYPAVYYRPVPPEVDGGYREILSVADANGGKLQNRVMFYCDEWGTLPPIQSAEMMYSASRPRRPHGRFFVLAFSPNNFGSVPVVCFYSF